MLRAALSLRFLMLLGSAGALVGAALMFWEGGGKLASAVRSAASGEGATIALVMGATDAFLFGVVLMIFAYAITFGLVFELSPEDRARLPKWARIEGVGELKRTLVEVILVYLIVDFATDIAESEAHQRWDMLALPVAVLLIAGALRLMGSGHEPESESTLNAVVAAAQGGVGRGRATDLAG
jgi:uncharacterized membrane protein YqhA